MRARSGKKLDSLKIPFEVNPEGTMIKVPSDQVGRARMALAQEGLPSGGSLGYHEIFRSEPILRHDQLYGKI